MPSNPEFTAPDYTSQTAAQYKANIDASIAANGADAINLGLVYSSSTLSVTDATGAALSSTNPGFVKFKDAGIIKYISVEDNQGFIDDTGSSEIINNLFGLTTGVAYAEDIPFFLYAVANDARSAVAFGISRVPGMNTSPAVGEIGAPDDAVADNQYSMFMFDSLDETLYDGNPCTMIGSFRMQMSASDDWTVQALSNSDGIGQFQENVLFDVPVATFGAGTNSHFKDHGGTAPVFTTASYKYSVKDGYCEAFINEDLVSSAGVGAVSSQLVLPFTCDSLGGVNTLCLGTGFWEEGSKKNMIALRNQPGDQIAYTSYVSETAAERNINNSYLQSNDTYNAIIKFKVATS